MADRTTSCAVLRSVRIAAAVLAFGSVFVLPTQASAGDDATVHRRFDDAAKWSKVFDDPKRDEWQKPGEIVAALGLKSGDAVADIGAGTGYFEKRLSAAVGASGNVYAVEVEPSLVAWIRDRAEREATANVIPLLASTSNPRLPSHSVDLVLVADTFHHIDDRSSWLALLRRSLKPNGRVAIVDWKPGRQAVGPQEEEHKIAPEQVTKEMLAAGFRSLPPPGGLPYQYFLLFELPAPR